MKNQNQIGVNSVTVQISSDILHVFSLGGKLVITNQSGIIADCRSNRAEHPRVSLARYLGTLHADLQLDAVDTIRNAAKLVCPDCVSSKDVFTLYPSIQIRI